MRNRIVTPRASVATAALAVALTAAFLIVNVGGSGNAGADPVSTTTPPTASAPIRTITVTGHGSASGTPDVAELSVGVSSRAKSASDALGAMSDRANKLMGVITDAGVAAKDVQTVGLSLQPTTDNTGQVTGYEASTTVVADIRDISEVGPSIDAAAKQVGDDVRLDGVSFSIADTGALMGAARADAVKRARAQADDLAKAAGVELGDVQTISEGVAETPVPLAAGAAKSTADSVPVQPGTESVSVDVTVVFAVR